MGTPKHRYSACVMVESGRREGVIIREFDSETVRGLLRELEKTHDRIERDRAGRYFARYRGTGEPCVVNYQMDY